MYVRRPFHPQCPNRLVESSETWPCWHYCWNCIQHVYGCDSFCSADPLIVAAGGRDYCHNVLLLFLYRSIFAEPYTLYVASSTFWMNIHPVGTAYSLAMHDWTVPHVRSCLWILIAWSHARTHVLSHVCSYVHVQQSKKPSWYFVTTGRVDANWCKWSIECGTTPTTSTLCDCLSCVCML